ncbi:hypothetical protein J2W32_005479 [Variovorax boronicumulans]|uniref:hypothetical protein n=1 Tax=Variovorax boronicumulans TaxID=436515 RepID=UPI002782F0F6|nr:hypothetical protein [Variovorax boronicumulans]MDQ0056411.1 hypothetical protein [Variovorax boronicumulans]
MSSVPLTRSPGTLFAAALGFVVVLLDVSVVNVALDALRQGFGTDITGLQWVLNAYTLVSPHCCCRPAAWATAWAPGASSCWASRSLLWPLQAAAWPPA